MPNTPGRITGGGNLGDKATFGLTVSYDRGSPFPRGNLTYIDHNIDMRVSATDLESLVIEGTYAWFTGKAIVNEDQEVWFKVEIKDINRQGSTDWFKISLPDLNYEVEGSLSGGNFTIH